MYVTMIAPEADRLHPHWGKLGRFHVVEDLEHLLQHQHVAPDQGGSTLKEVTWDVPLGVLDQEDLVAQGIVVGEILPEAPARVDELGSCTANASTAFLSWALPQGEFFTLVNTLGRCDITGYDDVVSAEKGAIGFYGGETKLMGQPYPPTDGGCSGPYLFKFMEQEKVATSEKIAAGAVNVADLLQQGPVLCGSPWLEAWFEPAANGFVDGDGKRATVQQQAQQVAGGHEFLIRGIVKIARDGHGNLDPFNTVLLVRNSWDKSWGDQGEFLIHLSTLAVLLGSQVDFRQPN